jgi:hypothetical protein
VTGSFNPQMLSPGYAPVPAVATAGAGETSEQSLGFGNITIPVYIGQKRIETIVVDAINARNYITGGR